MSELPAGMPFPIGPEEQFSQVMVYTPESLYWGSIILRKTIRVSTWLRTSANPESIALYQANTLRFDTSETRPHPYGEIHIPIDQVRIFHLMPPAQDPLDYDPTQPNLRLEPVTAQSGHYLVKGKLHMPVHGGINHYFSVNRVTFSGMYDVEISHSLRINMTPIRVPYVVIRVSTTVFATDTMNTDLIR